MKCTKCNEREAVIHLTQVGDETVVSHLCEVCAAEKGLETLGMVSKNKLASYIAALGPGEKDLAPSSELGGFVCSRCGATLQDFRESGRLGCPECYRTLGTPLRELLRRLHGATRHTGERYLPPGGSPDTSVRRAQLELREQLKRAIESENFELAAQLRDQLKEGT